MLNLTFNPFPVLDTSRLTLRQITNNDAPDLFTMRSDNRVMKFIDRPLAKSIDDVIELIKKINDSITTADGITWAISTKEDLKLIGTIGYWRIIKENFRAEIGYLLHLDMQGKGFMQEAITAVIHYGFHVMKLHSSEARVKPENAASIKLLERNGYIREAYFREDYYYEGKFLDTAVYSLLSPVK